MHANIVYFSQMFQAVPALAQVCARTGGVLVSSRVSTLAAVRNHYPAIDCARFSKRVPWLYRGNRLLRDADIIVTGSPYQKLLQPYRAKKCMVFHGTYVLFTRAAVVSNAHFDLLCVTGPRMQSMIGRHADIKLRCVNTGFLPFAEFPEVDAEYRQRTLVAMGLDPGRNTLIYTPSRKPTGSWGLLAERLVLQAPRQYNLILRPHPSQALTARVSDRFNFAKIGHLCRKRGNAVLDLIRFSLPQALSVADLVISDANSPAEESLFYDLPQLFVESAAFSRDDYYRSCVEERMHPDDTEQLMQLYACGDSFRAESEDLAGAIGKAVAAGERYREARERYFNWVFGVRDRRAPERVAAAMERLLEES